MVDWDRIRELRDEIGEEDYAEVVDLFFAEIDEAMRRLDRPATLREREAELHFVKGSALNIGFRALGELCRSAEDSAAKGTLDEAQVRAVAESYSASRRAFEGGQDRAA